MIWLLLTACLPKAPGRGVAAQTDKGLSPATTTLEALRAARAPRRIAVLVGVDEYGDPSFPPLRHAQDDARELGQYLGSEEVGGYDEVHLLVGDETRRDRILEVLRRIRDEVRPEDVLVVSFSGHGTRLKDAGGEWHRFLLPSDARAADLAASALDLQELQTFFSSLLCERKVLIVDACFDGDGRSVLAAGSDPTATVAPPLPTLGAGEAHLYATSPGRPAREDDTLGHGVYTSFLLEAMSWGFADADADADGALTAWEAHDYARGRTITHTGGAQVPEATFRVVGEADVVLSGHPDARRRSNDALVYLYPSSSEAWSGAQVLVDGRSRGTLPGTVPLSSGVHHFQLQDAAGATLMDGSMRLLPGRSYSVDDVARLAQGPSSSVGLRAVAVGSAPFREALGAGAVGAELVWSDRREGAVGHGLLGELALGGAASPSRPALAVARPLGWVSAGTGWQGDRGVFRFRGGLGATAVWMPPSFGGPLPSDASKRPESVGWVLLAAGPDVAAGVVLGQGWTLMGSLRPHVAALAPDLDGQVRAVPFTIGGIGLEVDR